jgi:hypothetical protein
VAPQSAWRPLRRSGFDKSVDVGHREDKWNPAPNLIAAKNIVWRNFMPWIFCRQITGEAGNRF